MIPESDPSVREAQPSDLRARLTARIEALKREGNAHIESHVPFHIEGPDVECPACDDIFGQAWLFGACLAEVVSLTARIEQMEQELEASREAYRKQGQALFDQIFLTEQAKARIAEGHG